jgi:hypothetical protein
MGACLVKFNVCPKGNEQIDAIIKVPEDKRSVIHGVVKNHKNEVVPNAVVKLFEVKDEPCDCSLEPITHTFTDECGQFLFGPLCAHKRYAIKVWFNDVKITKIVVKPDDCSSFCLPFNQPHNCKDTDFSKTDFSKTEF